MTDIIDRLRSARCIDVDTFVAHALHDAEAEIERLREIITDIRWASVRTCGTCGHEFVPLTGDVCPICDRDTTSDEAGDAANGKMANGSRENERE